MREEMPQELRRELLLQINQCLYEQGLVPGELYETAKTQIVKQRADGSDPAGE